MELPGLAILLEVIAAVAVWVCVPCLILAHGSLQVGYDLTAPAVMFKELSAAFERITAWKEQNLLGALMLLVAVVRSQTLAIASINTANGFALSKLAVNYAKSESFHNCQSPIS